MSGLTSLLRGLREIIYPDSCLICNKKIGPAIKGRFVCGGCWKKIKLNTPPFCGSCGRQLKEPATSGNICQECLRRPAAFDRAFCPCPYEGVIKELIHEFKYNGRDYLGSILSGLISGFVREFGLNLKEFDWVIPVPMHRVRARERDFDHSILLARLVAKELNIRLLADGLRRLRNTRPQVELSGEERLLNVKGMFSVKDKEKVALKNVVLVDDVLTTGATASEAAAALKDSGCGKVYVLTVAN